jgi:hypothetical protein
MQAALSWPFPPKHSMPLARSLTLLIMWACQGTPTPPEACSGFRSHGCLATRDRIMIPTRTRFQCANDPSSLLTAQTATDHARSIFLLDCVKLPGSKVPLRMLTTRSASVLRDFLVCAVRTRRAPDLDVRRPVPPGSAWPCSQLLSALLTAAQSRAHAARSHSVCCHPRRSCASRES